MQSNDASAIVDYDGASVVVPGPPAEEPQKSRTKAYRRAYQRAHYGTVSACLPRLVKEAFRDACQVLGKTQHEVLADWVMCWLETSGVLKKVHRAKLAEERASAVVLIDGDEALVVADKGRG